MNGLLQRVMLAVLVTVMAAVGWIGCGQEAPSLPTAPGQPIPSSTGTAAAGTPRSAGPLPIAREIRPIRPRSLPSRARPQQRPRPWRPLRQHRDQRALP